jgi:mannose-6-phosphate isomerase-like protein (cupin superfamily)
VIVRSLAEAEAFTTADGSTIRELLGLPTAPVRNQSLAEATLEPGQATERHYHAAAEEIYYVVEGGGELEIDGERRGVVAGDAALIPPGARHQIRADPGVRLRFLCCCAPAYRHEDTFFD